MLQERDSSFLGKGFPFPLWVRGGEIDVSFGETKIKQSIYVILMTRRGERVMRPDFGSRIWDYVFELPSETYMNLLCNEIVGAVCRWEHRVEKVSAQVEDREISLGKLTVSVNYVVKATNQPDNLVFPFYLEEGQW